MHPNSLSGIHLKTHLANLEYLHSILAPSMKSLRFNTKWNLTQRKWLSRCSQTISTKRDRIHAEPYTIDHQFCYIMVQVQGSAEGTLSLDNETSAWSQSLGYGSLWCMHKCHWLGPWHPACVWIACSLLFLDARF